MPHANPVSVRRLLVINPNTNSDVTARIRRVVQETTSPELVTDVVNPERGPFAIETADDKAWAIPNVLAIIRARRHEGFDGYVLACFDDIAVAEARRLVPVPVVSMSEAGFRGAHASGGPFSVVTTVEEAVPTIRGLAARYGMARHCTVRAAGIGVAEASAQTERAEARLYATIARTIREDGARAILLGSGAFAGRARALQAAFGIPFFDGLTEALAIGSAPIPPP